jgi:hypothetical protein
MEVLVEATPISSSVQGNRLAVEGRGSLECTMVVHMYMTISNCGQERESAVEGGESLEYIMVVLV